MKLYEYQAKKIFKKYGICIPEGEIVFTEDDAVKKFENLKNKVVIKAQVHAGGRGKAGGIKLANSKDEVRNLTKQILNMQINGINVESVLVENAIDIDKEFYMSFAIDRAMRTIVFIASTLGGVDIEEVAKTNPDEIIKSYIDSFSGFKTYHILPFLKRAKVEKDVEKQILNIARNLYKMFIESDANLAEINPLVITKDKKVYAADAKVDIDDNAQFRQQEIVDMIISELGKSVEYKAKQKGLSYVKMEGNIGCVVNGAGLSMATMDIIKLFGGEPANFLDIGGSSNPEKVKSAMELLMADKNVKVAFFNIFGGITRCDDVANGIISALSTLDVKFPIVVRLTGTNEEEARKILQGTSLIFENTMVNAAKKAVELIR